MHDPRSLQRMTIRFTRCISALEELAGDWVQISRIVFEKLATGIDDDVGLVRRACFEVILERVVCEVVEDLESEEVAR